MERDKLQLLNTQYLLLNIESLLMHIKYISYTLFNIKTQAA